MITWGLGKDCTMSTITYNLHIQPKKPHHLQLRMRRLIAQKGSCIFNPIQNPRDHTHRHNRRA
jgi:hypothetical protein